MFNDNYNNSFQNPIKSPYGSYISNYNNCNNYNKRLSDIFCLPPIFNENDLENYYIQERKDLEKYFYKMKNVNKLLLQKIRFLNKISCITNVTHSNTINFIIKNNRQLKQLLNNQIIIFNENLNKIITTKEKIDNIDSNIAYIRKNY